MLRFKQFIAEATNRPGPPGPPIPLKPGRGSPDLPYHPDYNPTGVEPEITPKPVFPQDPWETPYFGNDPREIIPGWRLPNWQHPFIIPNNLTTDEEETDPTIEDVGPTMPGVYWDPYESPPRWVYEAPPPGPSHWWQWDDTRDVWIPTRDNPQYNRDRKNPNPPQSSPEKILPFRPNVGGEGLLPFDFGSPMSNAPNTTT